MENLKDYNDILEPDFRNTIFVTAQEPTNGLELKDIYNTFAAIALNEDVPQDIISQFNVARNLAVYSWFVYPFNEIAEAKAFSTLEYALKVFYPDTRGLRRLLNQAIEDGKINDSVFTRFKERKSSESTEYTRGLSEFIRNFRNEYAHGSNLIKGSPYLAFRDCADFINHLFKE